jgi:phage shock protein PspC (stress-responsive transcriptional regulator)
VRPGILGAMTTTESPSVPPTAPHRLLRRSRDDRIAAGVAGGLGEYFGLDPVLFRVLFAVSAFFGGAGIIGYVLAWAAIPEGGTQRAAVDGWIAEMRRRRIPVWVVAVVAAVILWALAFSWWAPGPFFPVIAVIVVLVVVFGRRSDGTRTHGAAPVPPNSAPTRPVGPTPVNLSKSRTSTPAEEAADGADGAQTRAAPAAPPPDWVSSARAWINESRDASRQRRRRAFPLRIGTLVALVVTLVVLGIADAVGGIRLPVYFWCGGAIVAAGLLVGLVLRRTPWSMAPLLIPAVAGMVAFGNTGASLHDGIGKATWSPTSTADLHGHYRLAFGDGVLDLRRLPPVDAPRNVDVTMASGQVKILLPRALNATVRANVRFGQLDVDGRTVAETHGSGPARVSGGGYDFSRTLPPRADATGAPVTITVHLADGRIAVDRAPA